MKIVKLKGLNQNPSQMEEVVKSRLLDIYGIKFLPFKDISICGKIHIESRCSSYYMRDPNWCGLVTITSKISLKAKDFK